MPNTTGKKYGGRKKGTPNKSTKEIRELAKELDADPVEFLLRVMMNDKGWLGIKGKDIPLFARQSAARDAAPYIHAKLKNIEHSGEVRGGILGEILEEINGSGSEDES